MVPPPQLRELHLSTIVAQLHDIAAIKGLPGYHILQRRQSNRSTASAAPDAAYQLSPFVMWDGAVAVSVAFVEAARARAASSSGPLQVAWKPRVDTVQSVASLAAAPRAAAEHHSAPRCARMAAIWQPQPAADIASVSLR